jgi:hypothetical protein
MCGAEKDEVEAIKVALWLLEHGGSLNGLTTDPTTTPQTALKLAIQASYDRLAKVVELSFSASTFYLSLYICMYRSIYLYRS